MKRTFRYQESGVFRSLSALALVFLAAGCAPLIRGPAGGENFQPFQEAENLFSQGKYGEARSAYHALSLDRSDPGRAEQSQFKAAYILVYYKNPDKDYGGAAREFEEFLTSYPSGTLAGEAGSWRDALKRRDQAKTNELLKEIDALTRKVNDLTGEFEKARTDSEAAARERDLVLVEKSDLLKKVEDLLNEKDSLLKGKAALLNERDGLAKDKIGLEKKVARLTREKEDLTRSKHKLEKSLRDLTALDVKMEKKRKNVK
jgi:hypothetical protein